MNKDNGPRPSLSFKETKILLDPSSRKKIFDPRLSASEFFFCFFLNVRLGKKWFWFTFLRNMQLYVSIGRMFRASLVADVLTS